MNTLRLIALSVITLLATDVLMIGVIVVWWGWPAPVGFTASLLFIFLIPSMLATTTGFILFGGRLRGFPAYLLQMLCGGLTSGLMLLWLDDYDRYFTGPDVHAYSFFIGTLPGMAYGLLHRFLQVRSLSNLKAV